MKNRFRQPALFHVLSLEDSVLDFEIISLHLIKAGYNLNISRVETKDEFTSLIRGESYDIILADYNLPQFDAFEALKLCQEYCPGTPFICVSGAIGETMSIELLKNGATDYVVKDRLERLPLAIRRALKEAEEQKEKKQVEQSLLISEEKYRTIFENVQDVFYQIDLNGIILEISPSIKNISQLSRYALIGKSVYDFYFDPDEREILIQKILKNGEVRDYEISFKTRQGEIKQTSINARLICNADGKPHHIDGTLRDITDRKLAEEAIKQSEAELNYAQQIAKMGSWKSNLITNKTHWSKNMYTVFGLDTNEKETTYEGYLKSIHPDDKYLFDLNLQEMMKTKSGLSYDFRYIKPDGGIIWVQNNIIPVFNNDRLSELHGVSIDITEKKRFEHELIKAKENAEASDRLKTAFMNNVSHEIRTPLNGILGFGQILSNPDFPAEEKEKYYRMLNESSDRLLNTVNNFMNIALLTSGNQKIYRKQINLENLIDEAIARFREACQAKDLTLLVKKPHHAFEYTVYTDGEILEKILHQLIDNALKFTSHGHITVGFEKKENEFIFFVKDSGIGISEENRQLIFGNFDQVDNEVTRQYQGTGLGLPIAKGLVEILGGKIGLDSKKGKGSTFYISIPSINLSTD